MRLCQNYFDAAFFVTTSINLSINKGNYVTFVEMKILFALSIHRAEDERVFSQQMETLNRRGFHTSVVSLINDGLMDGSFSIKDKMAHLISFFLQDEPDIIVGDSPIVILSAWSYKRKINKKLAIVYDVTEWVPSKKNLANCTALLRPVKWFLLLLFSWLSGYLSTAFLFGEYHKALPFRIFFSSKKYLNLSYYATVGRIKRFPLRRKGNSWCFCYSGGLSEEKGFPMVVEAVCECARRRPGKSFRFKIFSRQNPEINFQLPDNLKIEWCGYLSFDDFCCQIGDADIFFDLRKIDFENSRCLPIKLFYYMAAGRVVIYSDLKAIPIGVPEIEKFGVLVDSSQIETVVSSVLMYIDDEELFFQHCRNAEFLAKNKYDWTKTEELFVDFIKEIGDE